MLVREFRSVPKLSCLPVLSRDSPAVIDLLSPAYCSDVAEACDMFRLLQLLSRSEYQAVLAVSGDSSIRDEVSVYFARLAAPCWKGLREMNRLSSDKQLMSPDQPFNDSINPGSIALSGKKS